MIIGVPKEIKAQENRVAITPAGVDAFVRSGHHVYIETEAGLGSGFSDGQYIIAGAEILMTAKEVFDIAEMIIKVKEPQESEYDLFHDGQILFTYLHLAPDPAQTNALLKKNIIAIAYETVQLPNGSLPLLAPMSEVAGRMSVQAGAWLLEKSNGGRGMLLGGVPGVEKAQVVIVGGGIVGTNAAMMATGMGAQVTVLDLSTSRLVHLDEIFHGMINTLHSNQYNIASAVQKADLVIGAVLIPGAQAPKLVTEAMVKTMKPGSVLVDVAIDQGGSIETIDRVTTHKNPYFIKHDVVHYSVANIPGAVPRTSTFALTNATLPYGLAIANKGVAVALHENLSLLKGLNIFNGKLTYKAVADAQGLCYTPAEAVIAGW